MDRAIRLNIPHASTTAEEEKEEESSSESSTAEHSQDDRRNSSVAKRMHCKNAQTSWNEVVEKLFKRNESRQLLLQEDAPVIE